MHLEIFMVVTASIAWITYICAMREKVSLKSMPSTCVNPLATKWALCLACHRAIKPSTLYLILKIHLQLISLWSCGKGINIQILLSCKDWNLKSMAFFQCCESSKTSQKNGVHQHQPKNTYEIFKSSSTIVEFFLHFSRKFFIFHL